MRHYPADSPCAIARVAALALLADGAIDPSELATRSRRDLFSNLDMNEQEFDAVIQGIYEDLLIYARRATAGHLEIDRDALRKVLSEISHPQTQRSLLRAVRDIVTADGALAGGEAALIATAADCWGIDPRQAFGLSALPTVITK